MTPLTEALHVYQNRTTYPQETLLEAAVSLAEHRVFSRRAIAAITGLSGRQVARVVSKSDRTGGRLDPEVLVDLQLLVELREKGQTDILVAHRALQGCSASFAWRLTGIRPSTLTRWAEKAEGL